MLPTILALALALPPPIHDQGPPSLRSLAPPIIAPLPPTPAKTEAELKAIDQRFWEQHHLELCPPSCGMLWCGIHGGGWEDRPGAADPNNPNHQPLPPVEVKPEKAPSGHYETRRQCGKNGCEDVRVWVPDVPSLRARLKAEETPAVAEQQTEENAPAGHWKSAGRKGRKSVWVPD